MKGSIPQGGPGTRSVEEPSYCTKSHSIAAEGPAESCQAPNCSEEQFGAWHDSADLRQGLGGLGPKDGSGSGPRSGLTAKPCRPSSEGVKEWIDRERGQRDIIAVCAWC